MFLREVDDFHKIYCYVLQKISQDDNCIAASFFNLQVCRFVSLKRDFVPLNNFSSRMVRWWWLFNAMHYFEQALGLQLYMKETLTPVFPR